MKKKIVFVISFLVALILIINVLAITPSIGNARMILKATTGDILEKSILVKNTNDVAVNIILTASGDLQNSIIIKDSNFTLQPNEEKNAEFTIKVTKTGTTETKINVQFTPVGERNGAGLFSTIVVIANETEIKQNYTDSDKNESDVIVVEMPEKDIPEEKLNDTIIVLCNGCELNNKCYTFGFRIENNYCDDNSSTFINQKTPNSICNNNFECDSNLCINNQCVSGSLWQKILNWFSHLFSGKI